MDFWIMLMAKFVVYCLRGRQKLTMENIALRQQLAVLERNAKRPRLTDGDRRFWTVYSKVATSWQQVLLTTPQAPNS